MANKGLDKWVYNNGDENAYCDNKSPEYVSPLSGVCSHQTTTVTSGLMYFKRI